MIITLEHYGQPCLDSSSDKKVPLDIILPEQSYYPDGFPHPALRNIYTSDVASISTASDAQSEVTTDCHPTDFSTSSRRKRWRLFNQSFSFTKRPTLDPFMSGTTMVEKPCRRKGSSLTSSWMGFRKRWLVGWIMFSLLLCFVVGFGVWIAVRRAFHSFMIKTVNSAWSPNDSSIFTLPPELFGCYNEPSSPVLNGSQVLMYIPTGQAGQHIFTIQGGASGQITLASAPDNTAQEIVYDIVIQSNPPSLEKVTFSQLPPGPVIGPSTDFVIDTPTTMVQTSPTAPPACMRFDVTMYIPRNLRQLTVNVSTPVQINFSPQAHVELDNLSISITSTHPKCRIDSSGSLQAAFLDIEMDTGLIQGPISIGESTKITNWNGEIELDTIPNAPRDLLNPSTALLQTTSYGKVTIRYLRNFAYRRRPIQSWHTMGIQDTSIGSFDYGCSGFNGLLFSNSTNYNITNASYWPQKEGPSGNASWPIIIGNRTGGDEIYIVSGSDSIVLPDIPFI